MEKSLGIFYDKMWCKKKICCTSVSFSVFADYTERGGNGIVSERSYKNKNLSYGLHVNFSEFFIKGNEI